MKRLESVDTIRLLAIVSVIAIHTTPFAFDGVADTFNQAISIIINQFGRFAVPFFFVISGYFWGVKIRNGGDALQTTHQMASRIAIIFIAWCLIYLLPYNLSSIYQFGILGPVKVAYWDILKLIEAPITTLFQGTKIHLWFLPSLICGLYISYFFIRKSLNIPLIVFAITLYISGVAFKAYADSPIGSHINFNTRNGPFFSTLLFASGYFLSGKIPSIKWFYYGLGILITGCFLHFSEIYMLMRCFGTPMNHDYVFGTYFMGMGAAMMALSNHSFLCASGLSSLGKMALGIYAVHYIFVDLFMPIDQVLNSAAWEIGYVFLVLVLSILTTAWLSRSPRLRRFVT